MLLLALLCACGGVTNPLGPMDDDDSAAGDDDDAADDDDSAIDDDDSATDDDDDATPPSPTRCDPVEPRDLWDLDVIRDADTLDVEVVETIATVVTVDLLPVSVEVRWIRFTSWDVEECEAKPIRVEAYLALPLDAVGEAGTLPGLVVAHGLGGLATAGAASVPAAELGVAALAYSGPGQGLSEGLASTPDHLFDTVPYPQDAWFWGHATAAMRGLSVLETLPEVDSSRLGMTGFSGGGVATLTVSGVDDRVTTAVPVSASGHMDLAIAADPVPGWQYDLLQSMGVPLDETSEAWQSFMDWLDPSNFSPGSHADTYLICGTQDEFFPITSVGATYDDLQASGRTNRLLSIVDWDHGWFALFNGDDAAAWTASGIRHFFGQAWGTGSIYGDLDLVPQPEITALTPALCPTDCTFVEADVPAADGWVPSDVRIRYSVDGLTYFFWNLQSTGGDDWSALAGTLPGTAIDDLVWFLDVTYGQDAFGVPVAPYVRVTTPPHVPPGWSPLILGTEGPIPP